MTIWPRFSCLVATALLAPVSGCAGSPEAVEITPVRVDLPGAGTEVFQTVNFYVAGQPTEKGLAGARARGVRTVVNLRAPEEKTDFDERKTTAALGLDYVSIPVTLQTFSDARFEEFIAALRAARKQVLIHCDSGDRSSALWAAYLGANYGLDASRAIRLAERSGLKSDELKALVTDYLNRRKGIEPEANEPR